MGRTGPKMKRDSGLDAVRRDRWTIPLPADQGFCAPEKGEIREPTRPPPRHYTRHPSPIREPFPRRETGTTPSGCRPRSSFRRGYDSGSTYNSPDSYPSDRRLVGNPSDPAFASQSKTRRRDPPGAREKLEVNTSFLTLTERSPGAAVHSSLSPDADGFLRNEDEPHNCSRVVKRPRETRAALSSDRPVSLKDGHVKRPRERRNPTKTEAAHLLGFESHLSFPSPEAQKEYAKRIQRGIRFGCGVTASDRRPTDMMRPGPLTVNIQPSHESRPSMELGHVSNLRQEELPSRNRYTGAPSENGRTPTSPSGAPQAAPLHSAPAGSRHHATGITLGSSPLTSSGRDNSQTKLGSLCREEAEWEPEACDPGDASSNYHAGGLLTPLADAGNYSSVQSPLLSPLCSVPSKSEAIVKPSNEIPAIKTSQSATSSNTWKRNLDENETVFGPLQTKSLSTTNIFTLSEQPTEPLIGSMDVVGSPAEGTDNALHTGVKKRLIHLPPEASALPVTGASPPTGSPGPFPTPSSGPSTGPSSSPTNASKISTSRKEATRWLCPLLSGCRRVDVYKRLNKISEGTFGAVYRAQEKETGTIVALKHIKYHAKIWEEGFPMTSLREISILLSLSHPNIVDVKEVVVGANPNQVYMVMEYSEHELRTLLENDRPSFSYAERKRLLYQLLSAVAYIHDQWIIHRDLKTSNLLYGNDGVLKVCDFGMARQFGDPIKPYTHNVVTLWYRAPELLLGQTEYTTAVDIWSVGCIMGEIMLRRPLFNGKSETDALDKIFKLCGTPTESSWPGFRQLPYVLKSNIEFKKHPPSWRSVFPALKSHFTDSAALSDLGLDLLISLLALDPQKRPTAQQALQHPFFQEKPLPQRELLMPTAPDSNATARNPRHTRVMVDSSDGLQQRDLFHQCESRYVLGRRVDATRYLSELDEATQKNRAQKESLR